MVIITIRNIGGAMHRRFTAPGGLELELPICAPIPELLRFD